VRNISGFNSYATEEVVVVIRVLISSKMGLRILDMMGFFLIVVLAALSSLQLTQGIQRAFS